MKWKWNVPMDTDVSREANRQSGSDSWRGLCAASLVLSAEPVTIALTSDF
jgi:hypothetical protein